MAHKNHRPLPVCPNCQHNLTPDDNFCPKCGQENHDLRLPFGHVVYEVVEGFTHFDGKLWVTLRDIFTRPGRVPLDFIEGRRMRHVPPIRLYIFVSFFLFLLIGKLSNDWLERSVLRENRLAATFGPERNYRVVNLKALFSQSDVPAPVLKDVSAITVQFPLADSTGANTLRRWRSFTDTQLDSVIQLYHYTTYAARRTRLRTALAALPPQLSWLPLWEPANTKQYTVGNITKKKAGIDTALSISLGLAPDDTLGKTLFARLKALSPAQRARYNRVNGSVRGATKASAISVYSSKTDSITNQQFARLIDKLTVRADTNPIRFSYAKGSFSLGGLEYTTEAAARADVSRMREMTADERIEFYNKKAGSPSQKTVISGFLDAFLLKRALSRYVRDFDKSESEVETAQSNTSRNYVSYSFFLLMPLLAAFLHLFYRRSRKYYYVDHLILSINIHTVGFILFVILLLLFNFTLLGTYAPENGGIILLLLAAGPLLYFLLALRTVYQQSWKFTVAKFIGLMVLYCLAYVLLQGGAYVLGRL